MQLKIDDIEIPKSNPFQNCELGRKPYADILESLVCNGKGGCVMSLDGAWGTGKTTFVKMWQQQLNNHEFKTIYFNAWEHDYMTDPLVALMGELYNLSINSKIKNSFTKVVAEAEKIFCGIFPSLGKAVIKIIWETKLQILSLMPWMRLRISFKKNWTNIRKNVIA